MPCAAGLATKAVTGAVAASTPFSAVILGRGTAGDGKAQPRAACSRRRLVSSRGKGKKRRASEGRHQRAWDNRPTGTCTATLRLGDRGPVVGRKAREGKKRGGGRDPAKGLPYPSGLWQAGSRFAKRKSLDGREATAASAAIGAVMLGHSAAREGTARPTCVNHDVRGGQRVEPALGSAERKFSGRTDKLAWR